MKTDLITSKFLFLISLLGFSFYLRAQDTLAVQTSSTDSLISQETFDRINLDGKTAYRNTRNGEIITSNEYQAFLNKRGVHYHPLLDSIAASEDHWMCDKVNPYKDVKLQTPFMISFDKTTFTPPVDGDIVVTSRFGRRRRGPHRGIDIDLVTGDFVRSVLPGKVRFVGYSRGHGKTVVVRHANEIETVYAHLSSYMVKANDVIKEGQILGLGGNTGNSRGSHLHLEVRYKGVCIHPEYVFNFDDNTINGLDLWVTNAWKNPRSHSSYRKSKVASYTTEEEAIVAQKSEPKFYRVRKGDTLSHIARKHNLYVREICRMNSIAASSVLRIGQILKIR